MDAWKGADYTDNDHPLSARAALNQVRSAADMPAVTTDGDAFTESIRRERRVELAFEDHRFWDIRRWKIGDKTKAIYCIKINCGDFKTSFPPFLSYRGSAFVFGRLYQFSFMIA